MLFDQSLFACRRSTKNILHQQQAHSLLLAAVSFNQKITLGDKKKIFMAYTM